MNIKTNISSLKAFSNGRLIFFTSIKIFRNALWEFSRSHALAGNTEDIVILNQMIEYFVRLYNGTNESPILAFQTVSPGDIFDVDFHIRTQESKASGKISNVILTGLANAYTGEIIKKAVVEIN